MQSQILKTGAFDSEFSIKKYRRFSDPGKKAYSYEDKEENCYTEKQIRKLLTGEELPSTEIWKNILIKDIPSEL